jgi:aprataxin
MKVIVLVGTPGAGKSTFCTKYDKYVRISQDDLGSRYMCLSLFRKSLAEGKNIIVDRCNINKMQRALWVNIANEHKAEVNCVALIVEPEKAIERIIKREDHPTIKKDFSLDKVEQIVYSFIQTYEPPTLEEGFRKVLFINAN